MYKHLRNIWITRQFPSIWSEILDIPLFYFLGLTTYYWFLNFSMRNTFTLPFHTSEHYELASAGSWYLFDMQKNEGIAIILVFFKDLLILTPYFPTFGVIFESIKIVQQDLILLLLSSIILMIGFAFASYKVFGYAVGSYNSIPNSFMSLFRILMQEHNLKGLEEGNEHLASLIYIPFVIIFSFIILTLSTALLIQGYNKIRKTKELDSQAMA